MALVDDLSDTEIDELLVKYDKTDPKLQRRIVLEFALEALRLQRFKDWVHDWLDNHDVPVEFPDGPHTVEGCRIGDRLDYLNDEIVELRIALRKVLMVAMPNDVSGQRMVDEARAVLVRRPV
jgi:hypothetical protein